MASKNIANQKDKKVEISAIDMLNQSERCRPGSEKKSAKGCKEKDVAPKGGNQPMAGKIAPSNPAPTGSKHNNRIDNRTILPLIGYSRILAS